MTPSLLALYHLRAAPLSWFSRVSTARERPSGLRSVNEPFPLSPLADGDPHFVVEFPLSKLTACFNINGEPGHILRLVSDHKSSGKSARLFPLTRCLPPLAFVPCLQA